MNPPYIGARGEAITHYAHKKGGFVNPPYNRFWGMVRTIRQASCWRRKAVNRRTPTPVPPFG